MAPTASCDAGSAERAGDEGLQRSTILPRPAAQLRLAVGKFIQVGQRASYPLALVHARSSVGERVALIGNAAQALHPIAAQGFNLGLRDAAALAELIAGADDPGATALLAQYAAARAHDRAGMIAFTDRLVKLFCDNANR